MEEITKFYNKTKIISQLEQQNHMEAHMYIYCDGLSIPEGGTI